jgi:hypothetical protein
MHNLFDELFEILDMSRRFLIVTLSPGFDVRWDLAEKPIMQKMKSWWHCYFKDRIFTGRKHVDRLGTRFGNR